MRSLFTIATVAVVSLSAFAASPTPIESAAKEIAGPWQLTFTTPDGIRRQPIVIVGRQHQELVAWYMEDDKAETFKKVKLDDDALELTIRPQERKDIEVTFRAKLKSDNVCAGEATYRADDGDAGVWDFQGKRMTTADADEAQKWQLRFISPDDVQHEALVTVVQKQDKTYAWYASKDYDLPARKISVEGGQVELVMETKTSDGQEVKVSFRGSVTGDRVQGEAEYDLNGDTGSFPFSGSRKS